MECHWMKQSCTVLNNAVSYELSSYPSYLWRDLLSSVCAEIIEVTFCSFLTPVAAEVSY